MSDTYVECLVKAKQRGIFKFLSVLLTILAVIFFFSMFFLSYIGLLLMAIAGVGAYFLKMNTDL